ncbi:MAG: DNA polymerase III subunit alpha, partial [Armatimonadetes bacterium]|nr:DNA polymerase III subunit alpha [Armatimonadota bacterium]
RPETSEARPEPSEARPETSGARPEAPGLPSLGQVSTCFPTRVEDIPPDDPKTYEMLSRGETVGVFQLESGGMKRNIMELKPKDVRELAAMVALYRPGPMEHIPKYIDCKFGRRPIEYLDERMRPLLEETYGVIVYQDQVLKVVQALAGFSLGKADILRKAMGKKDLAVMESMKAEFMEGCAAHGVSEAVAKRIWELLLPFAGYAFNKAHAVCYAILAYQTAYLKANYPVEYMAALMAVYRDKEDRVTNFIDECRRQKIAVLQPCVNRSLADFSIERTADGTKAVRFGLAAIKGVGEGLVRRIIEERTKKPSEHFYEFAERMRPFGLNKVALEALVKAGALDQIETNRAVLLDNLEGALAFADINLKEKLAGQDNLFGGGPAEDKLAYPQLPVMEPFEKSQLLALEKEVMGVYLSDHPLRGYERSLAQNASHTCVSVPELDEQTTVRLAGVVANVREIVTRSRGERMASIVLEDLSGQIPCTLFPATYAKFKGLVQKDSVVRLKGTVSHRDRPGSGGEKQIEVLVDEMAFLPAPDNLGPVDEAVEGTVFVRITRAKKAQLEVLKKLIESFPGSYEVAVQVVAQGTEMPQILVHRIDPCEEFLVQAARAVPEATIETVTYDHNRAQRAQAAVAVAATVR